MYGIILKYYVFISSMESVASIIALRTHNESSKVKVKVYYN